MCQDGRNVYDLAVERRTIRRFKPDPVPRELLERLVNAARLAPSAANVQPLEFIIVDDARAKAEVFTALKWAAYIAPAGDSKPGEEPAACHHPGQLEAPGKDVRVRRRRGHAEHDSDRPRRGRRGLLKRSSNLESPGAQGSWMISK